MYSTLPATKQYLKTTTCRCVFYRLWITSIKEDDSAEDPSLSPVSNTVGHAVRILVVVAIPWVAKESGRKGARIERPDLL